MSWELEQLQKALSFASSEHRYEELANAASLNGLDRLDIDFILKCRRLLPKLLKDHVDMTTEDNEEIDDLQREVDDLSSTCEDQETEIFELEAKVEKLEGRIEELEERISIMEEDKGPVEGWDG